MFSLFKKIILLMDSHQRIHYIALQLLVILMSIMEILGIASIAPFLSLLSEPSLIETNKIANKLYMISGAESFNQFFLYSGLIVLFMLTLSSIISIITTWKLSLFAYSVGTSFSNRLYSYYLNKNWIYHTSHSTAEFTKQIATEGLRVTNYIISPMIHINARIILAILISIGLILYNPAVAAAGIVVLVIMYLTIYKFIKNYLSYFGKEISVTSTERFQLMNEGFGGIKDLILTNRTNSYIDSFNSSGYRLAKAQGTNVALTQLPRYAMELVAFGSLIGVIVIMLLNNKNLSEILPVVGIYALAAFKLLPAFQQIYGHYTNIKGNISALDEIYEDLKNAKSEINSKNMTKDKDDELLLENRLSLELNNISFTYPSKKIPALNNININIPLNSSIGFVGESGSGKSTLIDIIMGLVEPTQGQIKLDDKILNSHNIYLWQRNIGLVSQSIFLGEGSIAQNIAFGINPNEINIDKVKKASKLAMLDPLITSLPEGLNTKVGERGVQLSGGQRQRIGIARALYDNPQVLVLDEATSALDGITEKDVINSINQLSDSKTIIMIAHRLSTVKSCDVIYMLERGTIIDQGTYEELLLRNPKFRNMAKHS